MTNISSEQFKEIWMKGFLAHGYLRVSANKSAKDEARKIADKEWLSLQKKFLEKGNK